MLPRFLWENKVYCKGRDDLILFEDFTRCECGNAYLKKETFVLATYQKGHQGLAQNFAVLPGKTEVRYSCEKCNNLIFIERE